ncbi:MAG TPA: hypothetical protein GXZ36_06720 [Firmicutes bacterium]|nr:hypothetical protein [Bacillota bacterium]
MSWFAVVMFFFYFLWEKRKLNKRLKATITRLEQVEELLLEMCGLIEPFEEEAALISKEKKEQEKSTDSPVERKEDSAYEPAKQPVIAEAGDKQQEPVPRTKAQDVGGGSFLFEERTAEGPPSEGEPVGSTPAETGGRIEPEAVEDQKFSLPKTAVEETSKGSTTGTSAKSKGGSKSSPGSTTRKRKPAPKRHAGTEQQEKAGSPQRAEETVQQRKKAENRKKAQTQPLDAKKDPSGSSFIAPEPINPSANKRQMIIDLSNEGAPIKEIARQVGMGQGEVQLIIDLYSKK